jgi:hypothetical protein
MIGYTATVRREVLRPECQGVASHAVHNAGMTIRSGSTTPDSRVGQTLRVDAGKGVGPFVRWPQGGVIRTVPYITTLDDSLSCAAHV